jgi:cysteine-rich repeat protein
MRMTPFVGILMTILAVAFAGCGSGGSPAFENCGNGVVDKGEECDDGNLVDQDSCLATCVVNVCGDTFLNLGVEDCEDGVRGQRCAGGIHDGQACLNDDMCIEKASCLQMLCVGGASPGSSCHMDDDCPPIGSCQVVTCQMLGFASGTLGCDLSRCKFDVSSCTGVGAATPTATTTPAGGSASPTPAGTVGGPTPTATPQAGTTCNTGDQVVAMVAVAEPFGGLSIRLAYPAAANLPGTGTVQSVKDRVVFAHPGGLTAVNDLDESGDGVDDTLAVSVVNSEESPVGLFITATFDCVAGQLRPTASDFACAVQSASMADGTEITNEMCSVSLE